MLNIPKLLQVKSVIRYLASSNSENSVLFKENYITIENGLTCTFIDCLQNRTCQMWTTLPQTDT